MEVQSLLPLAPVLLPFLCAALAFGLGRVSARARTLCVFFATAAELILALVLFVSPAALRFSAPAFMGLGLNLCVSGFSRVYAPVTALMWLCAALFSREYFSGHEENRRRYDCFFLLTLGATMGVFLSADLITTFLFFEIMSFTSYAFVAHEETAPALRAANTYLAVAVIGGLVALMGLFLLQNLLGTLAISELGRAAAACTDKKTLFAGCCCLLFGFGAKAGLFPLHIWLPKAHPVAPAPASALLSGVLTKVGVFGIVVISAGIYHFDAAWGGLILALATVTMLLGAVLALLSVDLKRALACSSVSQIGFILLGVGMMSLLGDENALAARGALLHMVNHSLFKLTLFLSAGAVYMNAHALNLNDIRGFGRNKPWLKLAFLSGALGIAGVPGFSGYISKTLLHESLVEYAHLLSGTSAAAIQAVEWTFLLSGGLTAAYMAKLYVAIFVERHPEKQAAFDGMRPALSGLSGLALAVPALLIPAMGLTPGLTMDFLADRGTDLFRAGPLAHSVHYFAWVNLKGAAISLAIGAAVYLLVVRRLLVKNGRYTDPWPKKLDLEDAVYRPVLLSILPRGLGVAAHAVSDLPDALILLVRRKLLPDVQVQSQAHYEYGFLYRVGLYFDRRRERKGLAASDERSTAKRLGSIQETLKKTAETIRQSHSFPLLMACFGICFALLILLLHWH